MNASRAEGIEYHQVAGFPHPVFRCDTWRATLSVPACARRWKEAQIAVKDRAEQLRLCRQCPIGAVHAGEKHVHRAANFGRNICPRCERGTTRRMVAGRVCINCYNRQLEWFKGRNGKGTVPVRALGTLREFAIGVTLEPGTAHARNVIYTDVAVEKAELIRHVERVHSGAVAFFVAADSALSLPAWQPLPIACNSVLGSIAPAAANAALAASNGITADNWRNCSRLAA
jgi:hypothetical protein